ncbi:RNA polymerase sigma factor [Flagellimonas onchidii]|uniref:RNA polymerase sigma factor n=1 Tax=Flagellimonas onchidii TaxID=2562684 RepID=UPI0010A6676F|nr:sigma-70 family RNA polymerase sigma factor [Allomuricauda onchidii]
MTKQLEDTFLAALEQNQQKLFRICTVYSSTSEDAKDLFQEVLVHIWKAIPTFESKSSIGTWMFRVTINVCLRFRSKHTKRIDRFINLDSVTISQMNEEPKRDEQNEQLINLRHCIKQLNDSDKAVIALYLEELPYKEISNITGITENTVAVKIKRIKKKLLNCLNAKL